jgi:hypothetical protein
MPLEALGEVVAEGAVQVGMEAGGEAIHKRYGCKGCIVALLIIAALFAGVVYLIT